MNHHRLNVIRMLVRHKNITLFTLNAPQSAMNGVTPLGMAAWLNMPVAVKALLQDSIGTVSVDGMDSHGATALMCKVIPYTFYSCTHQPHSPQMLPVTVISK